MRLTSVLFVGVLLVGSSTCVKPEDSPAEASPPSIHPPPPPSSTTAAPTHPTTSTTTTPAPQPPTPTPAPTTPAPQPTTPSPQPTTPSPQPTTPTPTKPSPKPIPKEYYWRVANKNGTYCILAKADIKLELTYNNQTSKGKEVHETFSILPNATSSGKCDDLDQILELAFGPTNTITFTFSKNNETSGYHLSGVASSISPEKDNGTISLVSDKLRAFETQMNTSYECSWSEPSVLKENDAGVNNTKATLRVVLSNIQFEAFRNSTSDLFSKVYSCSMDSPDIVPIMVGIALGILVAVVLIAYLVGRRSTQAQGYLSM